MIIRKNDFKSKYISTSVLNNALTYATVFAISSFYGQNLLRQVQEKKNNNSYSSLISVYKMFKHLTFTFNLTNYTNRLTTLGTAQGCGNHSSPSRPIHSLFRPCSFKFLFPSIVAYIFNSTKYRSTYCLPSKWVNHEDPKKSSLLLITCTVRLSIRHLRFF